MLETGNRVMQARSEVVPEKPSGPSTHPGLTQKNSGNGSTISFHHIHYSVQVKPPGRKCGTVPTEILHDINGIFKPGMNGILGPTGGGKSSLLDILAGRKNPAGLEGLVLVDGHLQPDNFKCMTGYVVQDDVVMGTLTVRENFMFSANLRLPKSVKRKEKEARVEDTIVELGLTKCADSKVGTEFIRGVSGGERKRTNIGMELIISPSVLFLDEPTTGLDASTANAVMALLYKLSRRGRTIIFSIHQPRYSIFKFFDRLMLLGAGRTIYHGPAAEALQYFSEIGYQCEEHNNPPDFFLDVINGDSTAVLSMDTKPALPAPTSNAEPTADYDDLPIDHGRQTKPYVNGSNGIDKVESPPHSDESGDKKSEPSVAMMLSDKYMNSSHYKSVCSEIGPIEDEYKQRVNLGTEVKIDKGEYVTSFLTQLRYVSKRTILNLIRNPQSSVLQLVIMIIFSVLVGIIYLQIGDDLDGGIQNRIGAFFFIIMNQVFGNLSAVELFIKERSIFIHESASGFYRISAYFFAKLFCDLIPMRIVPLTFFCVIAYFMVGFQMVAAKFFIFYLTLFLTTMAASGVSFAISASVGIFAIANLLIAFCYVIMMVFGGLLVNLKTMGDWLSWLQYLSIIRYSLNSLSVNELKDLTLYQTINGTRIPVKTAGTQYLDLQGIKYATDWDFWQNIMALGIIAVGMMIIAYIQLRRIPKLK